MLYSATQWPTRLLLAPYSPCRPGGRLNSFLSLKNFSCVFKWISTHFYSAIAVLSKLSWRMSCPGLSRNLWTASFGDSLPASSSPPWDSLANSYLVNVTRPQCAWIAELIAQSGLFLLDLLQISWTQPQSSIDMFWSMPWTAVQLTSQS